MLWSSNDVTQQGSRPKTKLDLNSLCQLNDLSKFTSRILAGGTFGLEAVRLGVKYSIYTFVVLLKEGNFVFMCLRMESLSLTYLIPDTMLPAPMAAKLNYKTPMI